MGMHATKVAVGEGIRAIVAYMDERALQSIGNAFDFWLLGHHELRRVPQRGLMLHPNFRCPRDVAKFDKASDRASPLSFCMARGLAIVFDLLA